MRSFDGLESPEFPRPSSAPSPSHLDAPAATGKVLAAGLAELRPPVGTVGDLLEHVPFRHDDFRSAGRLADMRPGEEATVVVTVDRVRARPTRRPQPGDRRGRRARQLGLRRGCVVQPALPGQEPQTRDAALDSRGAAIHDRRRDRGQEPRAGRRDGAETLHTSGLVPVYPASEVVSSRRLRTLVAEQLHHAGDRPDALPAEIRSARRLPLRRDALVPATNPGRWSSTRSARRRLAYDELLLLQRGLVRHRRAVEAHVQAPSAGRRRAT